MTPYGYEDNLGSIPGVAHGPEQRGPKRLFYGNRGPETARMAEGTVHPGYGLLQAGQIMAVSDSDDLLIPYVPDTEVFGESKGAIPVISNLASGEAFCYVVMDESYKLAEGDEIIIAQGTSYHDGGVITDIDRDTDSYRAKITFTEDVVVNTFTTANKAHVYVKSGASGKMSAAKYILARDIYTGYGQPGNLPPRGALAPIILGEASVYVASLVDYDAQALADITTLAPAHVYHQILHIA